MRIYISGPMTGRRGNNRKSFNDAAKMLRNRGHFVINPVELSAVFGDADKVAAAFVAAYGGMTGRLARATMEADLSAVRSCDAIYLLRGWEDSRGAKNELSEAIAKGLKVFQEGAKEPEWNSLSQAMKG